MLSLRQRLIVVLASFVTSIALSTWICIHFLRRTPQLELRPPAADAPAVGSS